MTYITDRHAPNAELSGIAINQEFIQAALSLPDQQEALQMIEEQAALAYDAQYGGQISALESEAFSLTGSIERKQAALTELERQLYATNPTIKAIHIRQSNVQTAPALRWFIWGKDLALSLILLMAAGLVLIMGASNIYTVILSSGNPVFLNEPHLAMMLAVLLPIGSFALKFAANYLPHDKAKKRFGVAIFMLTAFALSAWTVLFGLTFGSAAGGIDWDTLGESNTLRDDLFTIVQILSEMLTGTALLMVFSDVLATYLPSTLAPNPAYEELKQMSDVQRLSLKSDMSELKTKQEALAHLKAKRQITINQASLLYRPQAARLWGAQGVCSKTSPKAKGSTMKKTLLTAILFTILCLGTQAQARNIVIGLSPQVTAQDAKTQATQVLKFLTKTLESGQKADVFNALNNQKIGTFSVPESPAYNSEKARLKANAPLVRSLLGMEQSAKIPEGEASGEIKLPQFLDYLAQNGYAQDADIAVIGSPIYNDSRNPDASMTDVKYVPDEHFGLPALVSAFSLIGKENALKGSRVHQLILDESWKVSEDYEHVVKRQWTLFLEGQGAALSTWINDWSIFWERVKNSAPALPHTYKRGELEQNQPSQNDVPIHKRALSTLKPPKSVLAQAQTLEIGITWDCAACDVDLYAKPSLSAQALSFKNKETPEGIFHTDYMSSPERNRYETISFTKAVDLRGVVLAVNLYGGSSPEAVRGEIRISLNGKTYGHAFSIKAISGNAGDGAEATLQNKNPANDHWVVLTPEEILGF